MLPPLAADKAPHFQMGSPATSSPAVDSGVSLRGKNCSRDVLQHREAWKVRETFSWRECSLLCKILYAEVTSICTVVSSVQLCRSSPLLFLRRFARSRPIGTTIASTASGRFRRTRLCREKGFRAQQGDSSVLARGA